MKEKKEAIEFAEWIGDKPVHRSRVVPEAWCYNTVDRQYHTTSQLYDIFIDETAGK